ncbi:prepilin-type N-terminal cleavage/methylation domain-containing protein [Acidobacteriota bacterium]
MNKVRNKGNSPKKSECNQSNEKKDGFSLIEVLVGLALVAVAILGLAQLFTYSVLSNSRSERMTSSTFLAQQQIDFLRNLPADELNKWVLGDVDEFVDVNLDGTNDFRRITRVQYAADFWDVRVLVFAIAQQDRAIATLIADPMKYKVLADVNTIVSR